MPSSPYNGPKKTPYGAAPIIKWAHKAGPCPACGSDKTVRDHYVRIPESPDRDDVRGCLIDSCLLGCDPVFWIIGVPVLLFAFTSHALSKKRRECSCTACGRHWRSIR